VQRPDAPPTLDDLRAEFRERQEKGLVEADARVRRNVRNATIAGAAAGLAAVLVTAGVTRQAIFWHSFLLETMLGAGAGYALARCRGGVLAGILLFAGSYFVAFLARALGLDPTVLFHAGDFRAGAAVQGHVTTLCFLVSTGGVLGHVIADT